MSGLIVAGIDASLTCTGLATIVLDTHQVFTDSVRTSGKHTDKMPAVAKRLRGIVAEVYDWAHGADLVVIEGPSFSSLGAHVWDRGGLWWQIVMRLHFNDIPVAVASPAARAKYATGNGGFDKVAVCAAVTGWGLRFGNDNEADAIVLAAMGADRLGAPLVAVPAKTHGVALVKVDWPLTLAGAA